MKKTILKIAAMALLGAMLCVMLIACDNNGEQNDSASIILSGTYSNVDQNTGMTFEFSEDGSIKVQRRSTGRLDFDAAGTYTIVGGKLTVTYIETNGSSSDVLAKCTFTDASFELGEGFIKINGKEYKSVITE